MALPHTNPRTLYFFQMASKLILGCLALMVASTYARSSKFSFLLNFNTNLTIVNTKGKQLKVTYNLTKL